MGEVQSGKTQRTQQILQDLIQCLHGPIAVLDLAPLPTGGIGGKLEVPFFASKQVSYFSPLIIPPRLTGRSEEEIWQIAGANYIRSEEYLSLIAEQSWAGLVLNDVSLYLHQGTAESLWQKIKDIPTVVMNGYFGRHFGQSALSYREQKEMTKLMLFCEQIYFAPPIKCAAPKPR